MRSRLRQCFCLRLVSFDGIPPCCGSYDTFVTFRGFCVRLLACPANVEVFCPVRTPRWMNRLVHLYTTRLCFSVAFVNGRAAEISTPSTTIHSFLLPLTTTHSMSLAILWSSLPEPLNNDVRTNFSARRPFRLRSSTYCVRRLLSCGRCTSSFYHPHELIITIVFRISHDFSASSVVLTSFLIFPSPISLRVPMRVACGA